MSDVTDTEPPKEAPKETPVFEHQCVQCNHTIKADNEDDLKTKVDAHVYSHETEKNLETKESQKPTNHFFVIGLALFSIAIVSIVAGIVAIRRKAGGQGHE